MKTPKIKNGEAKNGTVDWSEVARKQLESIKARRVHETDRYIISVEGIKKPLNYEIYPIKNGKIITAESQRCYTDLTCGKDFAIEVANDTFK